MSVSEVSCTDKQLRIVLSEYGKPVESLKSGEVTVSGVGIVSWEKLGFCENPLSDEDYELADRLWNDKTKTKIVEIIEHKRQGGFRIKANSHVGHIAFNKFDLVILPKFDNLADIQNSPLLRLLEYAFNLDNLKIVGEHISPAAYFAEILIHWLLQEVRNIQRRGLFQQYRKERRDLSVIRGKFDLKTWLRRGCIPSERMPCIFYRRSLDNILNQTLCAGLRRSVAIANSNSLKSQCQFLADTFAIDGVSDRTLDYRMLAEARRGLNRLNAHYENAIKIVRMLYEGSGGFVLGDPRREQIRIPGFFFDMNVLFETIIGKFLKENLSKNYKVKTQNRFRVFFDKSQHENNLPGIRPDVIVSKKNENGIVERLVLDTKYKDIEEKGIGSTDLYQLSIYALISSHYGGKHRAMIVYPADLSAKECHDERHITLRRSKLIDPLRSKLCEITLHPVDLRRLAEVIGKDEEERNRFALGIVGE